MRLNLSLLSLLVILVVLLSGCGRSIQTSTEQQFNQTIEAALNAFRKGNPDAGNRFLNAAVAMTQDSRAGYAEVARRVSSAGRHADAANFLRGALKKRNLAWDPVLWAMLAEASRQAGDTARQQEAEAEAARRAGEIMAAAGKTEKERPAFAGSEPIEPFLQAGSYYLDQQKDFEKAIKAFREAVRINPKSPEALNYLGYTLADKGATREHYAEALERTREAVRLAPGNAAILDSYGWALYRTGDLKGARRALREAVDAAPNVAELRYHLGVVYAALGMTEEADTEFTRALRIDPDYEDAKKAKAALRKPTSRSASRNAISPPRPRTSQELHGTHALPTLRTAGGGSASPASARGC